MHKEIAARAERAISEGVFPGCVVGIVRDEGRQEMLPFGGFTYEADSPRVHEDTIYDMASVTKSVPVASLAILFVQEGRMRLTDTVTKYLPELQHDYNATIEDLLRYRVSGPRLSTLQLKTFEEIRTHILESGFSAAPAGTAAYSNVPAFLLGMILERVGGAILPALSDKYFFGPLGMHDTSFFPSFAKASEGKPHEVSRVAPTEIVGGVEVCGIVHDESARVFARARRAVGHAGLFSTVPDILTYLDVLMTGDFAAVVQGAEAGLGWQVDQPWFMGRHAGTHTFGKTGFTGTSLLFDARRRRGLVILSNRTYPTRPADASLLTSAVNIFRADIADIVLR